MLSTTLSPLPEVEKKCGVMLCDWFGTVARDLPWRRTRDPYKIWVSEVMLQQTRVETVLRYYTRFLEVFPNVRSLAYANLEQVNLLWQGLGYYRRAALLKKGAEYVADTLGGCFPSDPEELKKVPGIGEYTAGAIASFAFDAEVPAVDGNVLRVVSRIFAIGENVDLPDTRNRITEIVRSMIPSGKVWSFNQSLMELGALVCIPGIPHCEGCPLVSVCSAKGEGNAEGYPVKTPRKKQKILDRTVYVITDGQHVLLHRRPETGMLAGLWEFPGWPDADNPEGLVPENMPWEVSFQGEVFKTEHVFTHRIWQMRCVRIQLENVGALPQDHGEWLWIPRERLDDFPIPSAMSAMKRYALSMSAEPERIETL